MLKTLSAAALAGAVTFATLPLAHAGDAPMEAAGTSGEHTDMKAMKKAGTMKHHHHHMKHKKMMKKM